jgi:hypothetical protein
MFFLLRIEGESERVGVFFLLAFPVDEGTGRHEMKPEPSSGREFINSVVLPAASLPVCTYAVPLFCLPALLAWVWRRQPGEREVNGTLFEAVPASSAPFAPVAAQCSSFLTWPS